MDEKHDIRQELAIILPSLDPDKKLCGVCGGIAEYFNIDSTLVRLAWVVFCLLGGSGVLAYIIAALIMPDRPY